MILRRLATSIRKQDWFTVLIETLIVVLGVFLGIQLGNWNEARQEFLKSQSFTARLLDDLRVEYEYAQAVQAYANDARANALTVLAGLEGAQPVGDRELLIAAYRASQFQWYERRSAAFDELLSSGELALISNGVLRETAVRYYSNSLTVFDLMLADATMSDYRKQLFGLLDESVLSTLREACGDRSYTSSTGITGVFTIDYDCTPDLSDREVAESIAALKAASDLIPALRTQAANQATTAFNIDYMLEYTGAKALIETETGA